MINKTKLSYYLKQTGKTEKRVKKLIKKNHSKSLKCDESINDGFKGNLDLLLSKDT